MKALIFDFDGLVLDTEGPEFRSWREIWEQHGAALRIEEWSACIGTSGKFDAFEELERALGRPVDRDAVREQRNSRFSELLHDVPPLPGVLEYLETARTLGLATAIASSSTRTWVEENLRRLGIASLFDAICCRDDVGVPKPNPAVYLGAMDRLVIRPHEAIAFEDSPNGIAAAKSAGLFCVAVPCGMTAALDLSQSDLRLQSLAEMPLSALLQAVAASDPDWSGSNS